MAQDKLIKTSNDTINCVIKEIGDLEIKYANPDISKDILFGIDKANVSKIILANGKEMYFSAALTDPDNYADNHKNAIKINFLSPLFNSFNFNYERSLKPGHSIEGTIGIIGMGNDIYSNNEKGVFMKLGYKFIKSPDYYLRGQRYAHILKGAYIRPEIAFSSYSYDSEQDYYYSSSSSHSSREDNLMFALLLNFGKQWVIDNGFIIDTFIGVGYAFGDDSESHGMHKAFIGGVDEFPMAFTMGVRVGWCF
jgi:hypothetical protein